MQLTRQKKTIPVAGLEIVAGSVAATEVSVNGSAQLRVAAIEPLLPDAFQQGEVKDADALVDALKALFSKHKISKRVRLGLANQGVVVRTLRLPAIENPKELDAAVRFQAQEQIPMPLEQAVLEHQVVGGVPAGEGGQPLLDVVVVAARRSMISSFLEPLRRAGLDPVGVDLSAFGMIRALADSVLTAVDESTEVLQGPLGATLFCSLSDVTNLAVARGRSCLFTRVSDAGLGTIATRLSAGRELSPEQAGQWLAYVGLERPVDQIEGDPGIVGAAREALEAGVTALVEDLRLSLDYYSAQEAAVAIERVVLCGPGSVIAGFLGRIQESLHVPVTAVRPPALASLDASSAARLTLPFGLALEE